MARDSFRVNSGVKRIEVNDDGEFITLNLNDAALMSAVGEMQKKLKTTAENFQENAEAIIQKDISDDEKKSEIYTLNCDMCKSIAEDVDNLLGADTCRKVFGAGIVPDLFSFLEFFEHLAPYIRQFNQERAAKLNKYNPGRTGSL